MHSSSSITSYIEVHIGREAELQLDAETRRQVRTIQIFLAVVGISLLIWALAPVLPPFPQFVHSSSSMLMPEQEEASSHFSLFSASMALRWARAVLRPHAQQRQLHFFEHVDDPVHLDTSAHPTAACVLG